MLNLGLRKVKQETPAPQLISFHRTPQRGKHKHRTPYGLRSPQNRKLRFYSAHHRIKKNTNTATPQIPMSPSILGSKLFQSNNYCFAGFADLLCTRLNKSGTKKAIQVVQVILNQNVSRWGMQLMMLIKNLLRLHWKQIITDTHVSHHFHVSMSPKQTVCWCKQVKCF